MADPGAGDVRHVYVSGNEDAGSSSASLQSNVRQRIARYVEYETQARLGQLQLYFTKSEARDKTARIVQYGCKAIVGGCNYVLTERPDLFFESANVLAAAKALSGATGKVGAATPSLGAAIVQHTPATKNSTAENAFVIRTPQSRDESPQSGAVSIPFHTDGHTLKTRTLLFLFNLFLSTQRTRSSSFSVDPLRAKDFLNSIRTKAKSVQTSMSDARRTHRWAKEFIVLSRFRQIREDARNDALENLNLISKICLAVYLIRDHYVWLCKVKLCASDPKPLIVANQRWMIATNAFGCVYQTCVGLRHWRAIRALRAEVQALKDKQFASEQALKKRGAAAAVARETSGAAVVQQFADEMGFAVGRGVPGPAAKAKATAGSKSPPSPHPVSMSEDAEDKPAVKKLTELDLMRLNDWSRSQRSLEPGAGRTSNSTRRGGSRRPSVQRAGKEISRRGSLSEVSSGGPTPRDREGSKVNVGDAKRAAFRRGSSKVSNHSRRGRSSSGIGGALFGRVPSFEKRSHASTLLEELRERGELGVGSDESDDSGGDGRLEIRSAPPEDAKATLFDLTEQEELEKRILFHRVKRRDAFILAAKSALLIAQGLHNGELYKYHDFPIGLLGVLSSLIDMRNLWPAKPAVL